MAYNPNTNTNRSFNDRNDRGNRGNDRDEQWKAAGFLNLYLPAPEGGRKKLGAIPLKTSITREKQLLDWLNADPTRVGKILEKLEIEYQSAAPEDAKLFALED
jgi:hypothetical protein